MQKHKSEIAEKYKFLLSAPQEDPDGVDTHIRYARKTKEQYVRSEVDGKPTGWSAYYSNGMWSESDKRKKS